MVIDMDFTTSLNHEIHETHEKGRKDQRSPLLSFFQCFVSFVVTSSSLFPPSGDAERVAGRRHRQIDMSMMTFLRFAADMPAARIRSLRWLPRHTRCAYVILDTGKDFPVFLTVVFHPENASQSCPMVAQKIQNPLF